MWTQYFPYNSKLLGTKMCWTQHMLDPLHCILDMSNFSISSIKNAPLYRYVRCMGDLDLNKPHYMSWIFKDIINKCYDPFRPLRWLVANKSSLNLNYNSFSFIRLQLSWHRITRKRHQPNGLLHISPVKVPPKCPNLELLSAPRVACSQAKDYDSGPPSLHPWQI